MPELPEVQTITTALEKTISTANIINVEVFCNAFRVKVDKDKALKLKGANIVEYKRIGKYMIVKLDNQFSMVFHFGMSGKITINPEAIKKHDHIKITTSNGVFIYNDPRRFGIFDIVLTSELFEQPYLKNMGIDPFDKNLDAKYLFEKLKNKKLDIKTALLDQSIIAGIGNIYASEILFKAKVAPLRESHQIKLKECEKIIQYTQEVLSLAIEKGGSTLKDYLRPDGKLGYFQNLHCVYGKDGQRCNICNTEIKRIVQHARATFFCSTCQK